MEYSEDGGSDVAGRKIDFFFCFIWALLSFVQIVGKQQGRSSLCETYVLVSLTSGSCFSLMNPINICGDYLMSA